MPNESILEKMGITDDQPNANLGPEQEAPTAHHGAARRVFQPNPVEAEETHQEVPVKPVQPTLEFTVTDEYQLKDEEGKPLGPPQKFTAKGATELEAERNCRALIRGAHENAARKLKEYRDKYRTMDTQKYIPELKPRSLTAADRLDISRKLNHTDTVDEAFDQLFEAKTGYKPDVFRAKSQEAEMRQKIADKQAETKAFTDAHPEYPRSDAARDLMILRLQEKNLDMLKQQGVEFDEKAPPVIVEWNKHNLEIVFEELVAEGRLTPDTVSSQETSQEEATPPVVATVPGAITPETQAARTRPRGTRHSSMTPSHSSVSQDVKQQQSDEAFLREVNQMSRNALLLRLKSDKKFATRLDSIKLIRS